MQYIAAQDRHQVMFTSLKERITVVNAVRFIEAFVAHLEPGKPGYQVTGMKTEGRPPYESKLFLKIYLYGYLNALRSSHNCNASLNAISKCNGSRATYRLTTTVYVTSGK